LLMNPQPHAALEIMPVCDEALCLVGPADPERMAEQPVSFAELAGFPLILPEHSHAVRKLLDSQAALGGVKLQIAWEMSSIQSILDLVRNGYGYAVLARTAVASCGQPTAFALRPIVEPHLTSTLCLATSAHKQLTPLVRHVQQLLRELIRTGPASLDSSHSKM
jgi:LysR family nitrogen assimilation transcriptional regulator